MYKKHFFIHLSINGLYVISISWLLQIMLYWTWRYRYLFKVLFSFPLDVYPGVGLLDHMVVIFLTFWGNYILFSTVAASIYIPTNSAKGSLFSTSLPIIVISCLLITATLKVWGNNLICDDGHLFMYLSAICVSSLEKYLFFSSVNFLIWLFGFLSIELYEFFTYFRY